MTTLAPLFAINQKMDQTRGPHGLNEACIESLLIELEASRLEIVGLPYWLIMARLTELTLLCAGHYADSGEHGAAGDLLVNPREVCITSNLYGISFTKNRHGRLSEQLKRFNQTHHTAISLKEVDIQIVQPALLPYFKQHLSHSGFFQQGYLNGLTRRMERIAATLGFLMAFGVDSCEVLHERMERIEKEEKRFIEENLCHFDYQHFNELGRRVRSLLAHANFSNSPLAAHSAESDFHTGCRLQ